MNVSPENLATGLDLALGRHNISLDSLLRSSDDRHLLLCNVHHIAADAWSLRTVFLGELQQAYAAFSRGQRPAWLPLEIQYQDYARSQRASDVSAHLGRWLQLRPKARDGRARTVAFGREGEVVETVPRGFYLRPSFTRALLADPAALPE